MRSEKCKKRERTGWERIPTLIWREEVGERESLSNTRFLKCKVCPFYFLF